MSAFDGIRVLELGQIYNGPYCGLLLAQLAPRSSRSSHPAASNCASAHTSRSSPTSS